MEQISMKTLYTKIAHLTADEVVLDVRTPEEFAEGHVPGSRNIPVDQVDRFVEELKKYKRVYIHCRSGGRATMASTILQAKGVKNLVCISGGGMPDWMAAGYPIER